MLKEWDQNARNKLRPQNLDLRFPGQYEDSETGHRYNYYRIYNSQIGRYQKLDPIGFRGGINPFAYVSNRPLSAIDAFELDLVLVGEPGVSGAMFNMAAETWANEHPGNHDIVHIGSGKEAIDAMRNYAETHGGIDV